jgi:hypothetical protein
MDFYELKAKMQATQPMTDLSAESKSAPALNVPVIAPIIPAGDKEYPQEVQERMDAVFVLLSEPHDDLAYEFSRLRAALVEEIEQTKSPWTKKAKKSRLERLDSGKEFIGKDEAIKKIEFLVQKNCSKAINGQTEEVRSEGYSKVEEGMGVWKRLIMAQMGMEGI